MSNGLLIVSDGEAPPGEDRVYMKSLYDMFHHTNPHSIVSLPFLGALQHYFNVNDFSQIKNALTELYQNLSYITLSGARDFEFSAVFDLAARISYLIKVATLSNINQMERVDSMLGELKKQNKASTDWLRRAEYLDTKDLDAMQYNYIFINSNKKNTEKTDTDIA